MTRVTAKWVRCAAVLALLAAAAQSGRASAAEVEELGSHQKFTTPLLMAGKNYSLVGIGLHAQQRALLGEVAGGEAAAVLGEQLQGLRPAARAQHIRVVRLDERAQKLHDRGLVIDDEHGQAAGRRRARAHSRRP